MKGEGPRFATAMMDSRLCLRCASIKSEVPEERLVAVIQRLQRTLTVTERLADCDSCGRRTLVYRLG
jgi:uncharacterized protein with PIN domain